MKRTLWALYQILNVYEIFNTQGLSITMHYLEVFPAVSKDGWAAQGMGGQTIASETLYATDQ